MNSGADISFQRRARFLGGGFPLSRNYLLKVENKNLDQKSEAISSRPSIIFLGRYFLILGYENSCS